MSKSPTTATVLMSGGIDSAACAYFLRSHGLAVDGLFIDYGQAAAVREGKSILALADYLGMTIHRIRMSTTHSWGSGELLGRNAFLIFTALFVTGGRSGLLGLGLHAGTPYYDCSQAFVSAVHTLLAEHTDGRVSVVVPFISWTKKDIYDYFVSVRLPIDATYSCEAGTDPTCGVCASCRERDALGC